MQRPNSWEVCRMINNLARTQSMGVMFIVNDGACVESFARSFVRCVYIAIVCIYSSHAL